MDSVGWASNSKYFCYFYQTTTSFCNTTIICVPNVDKSSRRMVIKNQIFMLSERDHKLRVQKHRCINSGCDWLNTPTIKSLFGTNIHPDLAKLQCEQGALYSYREAENNLEKLNCQLRRVNNHTQVKRITDKVGEVLSKQNQTVPSAQECAAVAKDIIIQIDGGHISIQDKNKRSFEALSAIVYRPESIQEVDNYHRKIVDKTCIVSAIDDNLQTLQTYLLNAALKQGISRETTVTALADGAKNCWSVLSTIKPYCATLECILDWFHIGKKFQTVKNALGEAYEEFLDSAKWKLWHGEVDDALTKLRSLHENITTDEVNRSKLRGLYDDLHRNQAYLVNYEQRQQANKTYTSQVAESHIDSLINALHKRTKKMQWTREGAHRVLQIRAVMASDEWDSKWQGTVLSALGVVA